MKPSLRISARIWFWAAVGLTVLKLWLTRGQGVFAIGEAAFDDRLFLELARHLARGEWLGPYTVLTLAKGPFYPMFIAAAFLIGVPLFLAQQMFYAAACAVFARALRPAIAAGWVRFVVFAALLWNPMSFDASSMGRVLRQQVYGPLALMIFAGFIALYLRRAEPLRRQLRWAALLGLAGAAFYLTREESVWLAPSVALLAGACLIGACRVSRTAARSCVIALGFALVFAAVPVLLVCAENRRHYGWFGTNEFRAPEFADAYGALLRVRVGPTIPYVPLTREARVAIAAVSPAFARLQVQLEAGLAHDWAGASQSLTGLPPAAGEIGGGWLMWALRDAADRAGCCPNARQALAFYRQLAQEVNRACDAGKLPAGPSRSGFLPDWSPTLTEPFVHTVADFSDFVVRFSRFSARPPPSVGSPEELEFFRDLTRERLSPPQGELDDVGAARYVLNVQKVEDLQQTGKVLRRLFNALFCLAQAVVVLRLAQAMWRRELSFPLVLAAAAWGACAASILMFAMIEVTSFPVLVISSFAPIYPLVLVFIVAAFWDAVAAWRPRRASGAAPAALYADPAPAPVAGGATSRWILLAGILAVVPFLIWQAEFQKLFWFGDDLFLLDQLAVMGMRTWALHMFSENFAPVFKFLWGGAALAFDGSYSAMLWLLWLTHLVNTYVFGRWLARAGFPLFAVLAAQLCFGLVPANLESLGWSVQWSSLLATLFLLLALEWLETRRDVPGAFPLRLLLPLFLLATASACSFSRGVLTGGVLALGLLLPALLATDWRAVGRRLPGAGFCLLPAAAAAWLILRFASGNQEHMTGHWSEAAGFGLSFFLFNPGHLLFGESAISPSALLLLAGLKLGVVATALWFARGRVRQVLLLLLAYDLGNALLVGIGRYHTGFLASMSSRYQYSSLLAALPFLTLLVARAVERLPTLQLRKWVIAASLLLLAGFFLSRWPANLAPFIEARGTEMRRLMQAPATTDRSVRVPALEFMHIERAKALQRAFDLH